MGSFCLISAQIGNRTVDQGIQRVYITFTMNQFLNSEVLFLQLYESHTRMMQLSDP